MQVEIRDGNRGEFTVLVDDKEVPLNRGDDLRSVETVTQAVRAKQHAGV
jgi:hypothetical protein